LSLVSGLPDESRFPVIDRKGQFLLLWDKKKMLTGYYSRKDSPAADPDNFSGRSSINCRSHSW